ncbi:MAG: hypothetical protein ACRED1_14855, partial [Limisphaerales bacterium]
MAVSNHPERSISLEPPPLRRKIPSASPGQFFEVYVRALIVMAMMALCPPLEAYPLETLTTNVQPMSGTANGGDEFPGAVLPFGMLQWSPDTSSLGTPGGYSYSDRQIVGFSVDHLSGAGCTYGGDFDFVPILGSVTASPCA